MNPSSVSDTSGLLAALGNEGLQRVDSEVRQAHPLVERHDSPEVLATRGITSVQIRRERREPGAEATLVVNVIDASLPTDLPMASLDLWSAIMRDQPERLVMLVDLRPMKSGFEQLSVILEQADTLRHSFIPGLTRMSMVRLVALVATDWTRHFWSGLLSTLPIQCVVCDDPDAAWAKAGVGEAERTRVERTLRVAHQGPSSTTERALTELGRRPGHSLFELARALGVSTRSLQRSLANEGTSFAVLREAARFGCAQTMLARGEKVTAVAATLGLESTSHFILWYKRRTGHTPGRNRNTVLFDWSPVGLRNSNLPGHGPAGERSEGQIQPLAQHSFTREALDVALGSH